MAHSQSPDGSDPASETAGTPTDARAGRSPSDRGDLEQVRARRVERADVVREILERKQQGDDAPPAASGAVPAADEGKSAPLAASEAEAAIPASDGDADGASHDEDADGAPHAEGTSAAGAPAPGWRDSGPEGPALHRAERGSADDDATFVQADDAAPHALAVLRTWRHRRREAEEALDAARSAEPNERRRRRMDSRTELDRALSAAGGQDFLRHLVDDVLRPDDLLAAGNGMGDLATRIPDTLSTGLRRRLQLGAFAGPGVPALAVPAIRRFANALFGAELTTGHADALPSAVEKTLALGATPRVRPLTDAVVGNRGSRELMARIRALIEDPTVPGIEVRLVDLEPDLRLWDFDGTADRAAATFAQLLLAAQGPRPTFLQLRPSGSRDLELTVETFRRALDATGLEQAEAGIALPAQFGESTLLLRRLAGWAHLRHEDGGSPISVAITRDGDALLERADAVLHSWRIANLPAVEDVDASLMRLVDAVLAPEHHGVLRLEVEGAVAMDAALAVSLSQLRRSPDAVSVVVPQSAGPEVSAQLHELGASVHRRIPLLPGTEPRPATAYLLRRIEEAASARQDHDPAALAADGLALEDDRLMAALARMHQVPVGSPRRQTRISPEDAPGITSAIELDLFPEGLFADEPEPEAVAEGRMIDEGATVVLGRRGPDAAVSAPEFETLDEQLAESEAEVAVEEGAVAARGRIASTGALHPAETGASPRLTEVVLGLRRGRLLRNTFRNQPDSDPTMPSVREWATRIERRAVRSRIGIDEAAAHVLDTLDGVGEVVGQGHRAGREWRRRTGWERAATLEKIAKAIDANRARLIEVAMAETSITFAEADSDAGLVIDYANYAAHLARQLDRTQGARFEPVALSVAVPGWVPPLSGTATAVLAGLAAGSAVILKPSPRTPRVSAIFARVLWAAGLPDDLVQVASCDDKTIREEELGKALIVDERVERVLFHGAYATAERFLSWRPDLPLIGYSGGKTSVIVTPSADYDEAARDIAAALVTTSGQRPARPSVAILVGAAGRSERLTEQFVDAVSSFRIGFPSDPSVDAGPLVEPAGGHQLEALTSLADGERWLLQPRALDDTGRLWTPGIRVGVEPESPSARNDSPAPVINIITVRTLDEAIRIQNSLDYGLVAGLYSLDRSEIAQWVQGAEAGNLYVNRDIVHHRVQRQPYGGWKRSMIGTKLKSGGPNNLIYLGDWVTQDADQSHTLHLRGLDESAARLIEAMQGHLDFARFEQVRRTALSCQIAWNEEFGEVTDPTNLPVERNLFRYRAADCLIRFSEGADPASLAQVLVAAVIARSKPRLSTAVTLPATLTAELTRLGIAAVDETDAAFLERMRTAGLTEASRLRLIGGSRREVCRALRNGVDIALFSDEVTQAGRVEMLAFLREQTISLTAHRWGYRDARVDALFPHERVADPTDAVV